MKAKIVFDFCKLFFYKENIYEDKSNFADVVEVRAEDVSHFNKGDIVEVLKVIDSDKFSYGKGYVIYNPKTQSSTTVAHHVLEFIK